MTVSISNILHLEMEYRGFITISTHLVHLTKLVLSTSEEQNYVLSSYVDLECVCMDRIFQCRDRKNEK